MSGPMFKPDLKSAPWFDIAEQSRAKWGSVTPFRLGAIVGLNGLGLACPYTSPRSVNLFREGVVWGKEIALKDGKASHD